MYREVQFVPDLQGRHHLDTFPVTAAQTLVNSLIRPRKFWQISPKKEVEDRKVVGFAMYYFTYDPWVGKQLYLEEFYVMDEYRGLGIGSGILRNLSNLAMKTRCTGMMFVVAENNEPSVQFYKRRGAEDLSQEEGWRLFRFDKDSLVKMAAPSEE
uniref:Diamine acetyltransferase 1 n=1 Tax=Astatotilapia calliptera TaxID=8154 RepID=A0AAX7TSU8_ASTCA